MKNTTFFKIFLEFIQDIYDAEHQIMRALPQMIKQCSNEKLKEGLTEHLGETKNHITRLEEVFGLLGKQPKAKKCKGMEGIIEEGTDILAKPGLTPAIKDCFITITAQQVEHYEIASYGSAISLAKLMHNVLADKSEFGQIHELLIENLNEEWNADKTLTKIAEGKMFTKGVNDELEEEILARK